MKGANNTYFGNIKESVSSLYSGLKLTFKHLWEAKESRKPIGIAQEDYFEQETGIITLQYPFESMPVPDNGRYRLHNEIEDCIVCDKCAKVCPVNCIDIEPVKATEEMGVTSDGTTKRIHAAKFDIDMAKCCFCGLCTTVCPTECLTMTKAYDFSEFDVKDHNYSFSEMTPLEILEKKKALDEANAVKEKAKADAAILKSKATENTAKPKPTFKPRVVSPKANEQATSGTNEASAPKPKFKPKVKTPSTGSSKSLEVNTQKEEPTSSKPKPVFRPKIKTKSADGSPQEKTEATSQPKPKFRPKVKSKDAPTDTKNTDETPLKEEKVSSAKPKPVFRPKVKKTTGENTEASKQEEKPKPKFRPKIKPKKDDHKPEQE